MVVKNYAVGVLLGLLALVYAGCGYVGFERLALSDADGEEGGSEGTASDSGVCDPACEASDLPNTAGVSCDEGSCVPLTCAEGFADCDGRPGNGCERSLTTLTDCGGCDVPCTADAAFTACASGTCEVTGCMPGFEDCDGDAQGNGCETSLSTLSDCGGCGVQCSVSTGTASCTGGSCSGAGCDSGFADCDGDSLTCETSLSTLTDCGACNAPCGDDGRLEHGTATCATGACAVDTCDALYEDCDGQSNNGCETPINTLSDCGSCGIGCSAAHASTDCALGTCAISACQPGYGDCRNGVSDGCETELTTTDNCGACGRSCGSGELCVDGDCLGYPFVPTNFPASSVDPGSAPTATFDCGTTTFDSESLSFANACGAPTPTPTVISQSGGTDLVLLAFRDIAVASGSTLRIVGDRPVIVAAVGDATFAGTLDASASGVTPGAGGNVSCGSSAGGDGTGFSLLGASGGGGGGFGTSGGEGGRGGSHSSSVPGRGGTARGVSTLSPLLAGCGGGDGGVCSGSSGAGGGAVEVSVGGTLRVSGAVRANGSNGESGCGSEGGGAGGGSGGSILLEGATVIVSGTLQANGGNGGRSATGSAGGQGGDSSRPAADGTTSLSHATGGGGGGGAAGRIRLRGQDACDLSGGNVSPAPSLACP